MFNVELEHIGVLRQDKVFLDGIVPILFTCTNNNGKLFIGSCCDVDKKLVRWLLAETTPDRIIELLSDKITIQDIFLTQTKEKYMIVLQDGAYSVKSYKQYGWDDASVFLPDDEYMDVDDDEFLEEINYYMEKQNLQDSYKKCIINEFNNVYYNMKKFYFRSEQNNLGHKVGFNRQLINEYLYENEQLQIYNLVESKPIRNYKVNSINSINNTIYDSNFGVGYSVYKSTHRSVS